MNLDDFISKYNGKGIDFDGYYGNQCVDLMNQYVISCLATSLVGLGGDTAYNIYLNANNSNFQKIANTPTGVPLPGDIVFWNTTIGSAGHVAVFVSGNEDSFTSFDQNWPVGSLCHKQTHDYDGVVGWLHPLGDSQMVSVDPDKFEELVDKSSKYDGFQGAGYTTIDDVNKKVSEITQERDEARKAVVTLNSKIEDMANAIKKDAVEDQDLQAKNLDLEHQINDLNGTINAVAGALQSSVDSVSLLKAIDTLRTPVDQQVKPLVNHSLELQKALDDLIYKNAPKKAQPILTRIIDKLFFWFR